MKARKKQIVVEAKVLSDNNLYEIMDWCPVCEPEFIIEKYRYAYEDKRIIRTLDGVTVHTVKGVLHANIGDYIIKGVEGEFYPCKPDIFKKTYEVVEGE